MSRVVGSLLFTCLASAAALISVESVADEIAPRQIGTSNEGAEVALLKSMEEERIQAGVRKDVNAIAAATADDYMQIDLDGIVRDKSGAMRRIESSQIKLQSNAIDELVVRIFGETAVVTGRSIPTGTINGKDFPPIRYSRVYVKREGRWQVVLFQMTRIKATEQ